MLEAFVEAYPRMRTRVAAEAVVRNGKPHVVDPTRRPSAAHYFRRLTPEELVRQSLVRYLTEIAGIDIAALDTEVNLARLGASSGGRRRTDLVISSGGRPVVLVELKREEESLISAAYHQARGYAVDCGVPYLLLCNGRTMRLFRQTGGQIVPLDSAPPELCELAGQRFVTTARLLTPEDVDAEFFRMQKTPPWAVPYLQALHSSLLTAPLDGSPCEQFRVVRDLGTDWGSYRNSSGSELGVFGTFRYLEVELPDLGCDIVGIAMTRYDKPIEGMLPCNRIAVGIGKKSCLEMQTSESFIRRRQGRVVFWHNGQINVAGADCAAIVARIGRELPKLYDKANACICFGGFVEGTTDADWPPIIVAILRYAIVREKAKAELKEMSARARAGIPLGGE